MTPADTPNPDLIAEIENLRGQLAEAEETLRAIRGGEVDALVVSGPEGDRVYTLKGEDRSYRVLVESVNEGALILTSDGTIMYANSTFARMIDVSLERIIGAPIEVFVPQSSREALKTLLRDGARHAVRREMHLIRRSTSESLPVYISISPMVLDEASALSVVVTDLTETKRTERELARHRDHLEELVRERTAEVQETNQRLLNEIEERRVVESALAESERFFRAVYDATQDAIVVADDEGRYVSANPAVIDVFGLSQDELVGHAVCEFMEPGSDFAGFWREFLQTGVLSEERKLIATDGTARIVESRATANMLPGRHLDVIHDVTGEVRLREQLTHQVALLQQALLPPAPKSIEGYAVASRYIPAFAGEQEIGGDFYDLFLTESGAIGLMIGDVSGKGIEAAALAAVTRSTVRAFAYDLSSPSAALNHANALLAAQQFNKYQFVTAFLALVDPATGVVRYASAGHPPAIVQCVGGAMGLLDTGSAPLGVLESPDYAEYTTRLDVGDRMVIYTDGISESRKGSILFGTEGIEQVLVEHGAEPPDVLAESILEAAKNFAEGKLRDDTALVIICRS